MARQRPEGAIGVSWFSHTLPFFEKPRKTELPSATAPGVSDQLGMRTAPFALFEKPRKTELPSATARREQG